MSLLACRQDTLLPIDTLRVASFTFPREPLPSAEKNGKRDKHGAERESISMDKKLTRDVEAFVLDLGADAVGLASVERVERVIPHDLQEPTKVLPGAETVVVFGLRMLHGALEGEELDLMRYMAIENNLKIDRMGFDIATFLERQGYLAINISSGLPVDFVKRQKGMWGYISHRDLAVEAGMGEIGLNNSLLHEKFGPRIYLGSVITTAPLECATERKEGICLGESCSACVEACPAHSLRGDGTNDVAKCRSYAHPYGFASLVRFVRDLLAEENLDKQKEMLYSVDSFYLWQALVSRVGVVGGCFECIKACPVGAGRE